MHKTAFEALDKAFGKLNEVQRGVFLAIATAIFLNRISVRRLSLEEALLIPQQVGGQAPPKDILDKLVEEKWLAKGKWVTFVTKEVERFVILKLARIADASQSELQAEKQGAHQKFHRR